MTIILTLIFLNFTQMKLTLTTIIFLSSFFGFCQENKSNLKLANENHDKALTLLINNGDLNKALELINKAIKYNPKNADSYYVKGNIIERKNGFSEALSVYLEALKINPNHVDANLKTAICYGQIKNMTKFCKFANF